MKRLPANSSTFASSSAVNATVVLICRVSREGRRLTCPDGAHRRPPLGGADVLVRVLTAGHRGRMADPRPHDLRARLTAPIVRLGDVRRGRRHACAHPRGGRVDPQGDPRDTDGAPHVRQPHARATSARSSTRTTPWRWRTSSPSPAIRRPTRPTPARATTATPSSSSSTSGSTPPGSRSASPRIPRSTRGRQSDTADRDHLAAKLRIADFAITQFFFEPDSYLRLVDDLAARGTDKPVIPGIMPITNIASVARMAQLSGAAIPTWLTDRLDAVADDPDAVRAVGVDTATVTVRCAPRGGRPGPALLHTQPVDGDPRDLRQPRPGSLSVARPMVGPPAQGGHE